MKAIALQFMDAGELAEKINNYILGGNEIAYFQIVRQIANDMNGGYAIILIKNKYVEIEVSFIFMETDDRMITKKIIQETLKLINFETPILKSPHEPEIIGQVRKTELINNGNAIKIWAGMEMETSAIPSYLIDGKLYLWDR
jgi:hypothetical protein